jgi:hypothetical protein
MRLKDHLKRIIKLFTRNYSQFNYKNNVIIKSVLLYD